MAAQRDLMRQKVNVTPGLIAHWEKNMEFHLRQIINRYLITKEDKGKSFEYQGRTFIILGMTENEHMILTEQVEGTTIYWEATPHFVQMRMGLFYCEWIKVNGITTTRNIEYNVSKLYLPSHKASRKKKVEEEEPIEDEMIMETYVEDDYSDESED